MPNPKVKPVPFFIARKDESVNRKVNLEGTAWGPKPCRKPFRHKMKKSFLYIYVLSFFSGMCIMAIELCASRLMAPYFGTSSFVWTNVIGVIMIALSIGYVIGGKLVSILNLLCVLKRKSRKLSLFVMVPSKSKSARFMNYN